MNPGPIARGALALLVIGLLMAAAAYGSAFLAGGAPAWAAPLLGVAAVAMMTATALLAAARPGNGGLAAALASGGLGLACAMVAVWTIPATDPLAPRLFLGLPAGAAHLLYGIGLVPAVAVPLLYARTFHRATLSEDDLRTVRAAARRTATPAVDAATKRP